MLKESCWDHIEGRLYTERPGPRAWAGGLAGDSAFVWDIEPVLFCNPGPGFHIHLGCYCAGLKAGTAR